VQHILKIAKSARAKYVYVVDNATIIFPGAYNNFWEFLCGC